jgi:predicted dehydrogenase
MDVRVRCAVIGTGYFAQDCHIPGLQTHPHAVVSLVCGRDPERTKTVAQRFGIAHWTTDWRAAVSAADIDAVTIAYPDHLHAPIAAAALRCGKHVFCEKPLGINAAETAALVKEARRAGRVHMVAFTLRYLLATQRLRDQLRCGRLGRVRFARTQSASWTPRAPSLDLGWRYRSDRGGTGVLGDVGSHHLDQLSWLLGPIEAVAGLSVCLESPGEASDGSAVLVSDLDEIDAALVRAGGVPAQVFLSRRATAGADGSWVEIVGDEGALRAALTRGQVEDLLFEHLDGSIEPVDLPQGGETFPLPARGRMMRAFVDAVLSGRPRPGVDATFDDGHAVQLAIDALRTSSREFRWVSLPRP